MRWIFFVVGLVTVALAQLPPRVQTLSGNLVAVPRQSYYVDATGGDDMNPGTFALPWETLTKVETSAGAGTTVYFKRGETWTTKGTAGATTMLTISVANLTIDAYGSGAKPIISGSGTVRNGIAFNAGATGSNTRNFRIYNCGGGTGALWANSSGGLATLEDSELDTHTVDAGGTSAAGSTSILRRVEISNFTDDGFTCHGFNGIGSAVYLYSVTIHDGDKGLNHSVSGGGNITTLAEDCVFYSNTRDIEELDIGTHTFNRCRFGLLGQTLTNTFVNGAMGAGLISNLTFNYCIFDATEGAANNDGAITIGDGGTGDGTTVTFNNCDFRGAAGVAGYTGRFVAWPSRINLNNCILSYWYRCGYIDGTGSIHAVKSIFHEITLKNLTSNTNEVSTADPLFVGPTTGDFHLQAGSPAIDQGNNLGLTPDFYGVAVANPPDVGAAEYVP